MTGGTTRAAALLATTAIALTLAACGAGGGTTAPTTGAGATTPGSQATSAPGGGSATVVPAATQAATTGTGEGGGTTEGDVCALVTADELAPILGVPSVALAVLAGPPDTCDIQSGDGAPLAATVLMTTGARVAFDAWASNSTAQDVAGLGDRAVFETGSQLLLVLKGERVFTVGVFDDGTRPEADRLALMKQIAAIAVGRM